MDICRYLSTKPHQPCFTSVAQQVPASVGLDFPSPLADTLICEALSSSCGLCCGSCIRDLPIRKMPVDLVGHQLLVPLENQPPPSQTQHSPVSRKPCLMHLIHLTRMLLWRQSNALPQVCEDARSSVQARLSTGRFGMPEQPIEQDEHTHRVGVRWRFEGRSSFEYGTVVFGRPNQTEPPRPCPLPLIVFLTWGLGWGGWRGLWAWCVRRDVSRLPRRKWCTLSFFGFGFYLSQGDISGPKLGTRGFEVAIR